MGRLTNFNRGNYITIKHFLIEKHSPVPNKYFTLIQLLQGLYVGHGRVGEQLSTCCDRGHGGS